MQKAWQGGLVLLRASLTEGSAKAAKSYKAKVASLVYEKASL